MLYSATNLHLRTQTSQKVLELRSHISDIKQNTEVNTEQLLSRLFDMGGIISGGSVLAWHFGKPIKDFDFYFNKESDYIKAFSLVGNNKKFDICWYFDKPYELHDMSIVMCALYGDGKLEITPQAAATLESGICELYIDNVIWPERTAQRMLKYNMKYGCKFRFSQVLAFSAIYGLQPELVDKLRHISVI